MKRSHEVSSILRKQKKYTGLFFKVMKEIIEQVELGKYIAYYDLLRSFVDQVEVDKTIRQIKELGYSVHIEEVPSCIYHNEMYQKNLIVEWHK